MERRIEGADIGLFACYFLLPPILAVITSYGGYYILGEQNQADKQTPEPTPTPIERSIGDFENSLNSDVQLTSTPDLNP